MILVDTSVWVEHLRYGNIGLESLLLDDSVSIHDFIIGELACGYLENRVEIIGLLTSLPKVVQAEHTELIKFLEPHSLMGQGLGYVDVHLLASALLTGIPLWTLDKKLNSAAKKLGVSYREWK